eukprot:CAMPEP_0170193428 /NCGR_PEP_ID=MMETSP0040_2-20121228/56838_1 /TAXON_ID=641309 /ORGANISM="Lotharella oceanica, Strain CCMP622" /LENGTH=101 /DNA_ID=CAMNT_0010442051 /DNA_START=4 /DNA_END=309 /DNA_ORIENTATION=+
MTAVCVCFQDGKNYGKLGDQFIPGRFHEYSKDSKFKTAYLNFAKAHGYEGEKLMSILPQQSSKYQGKVSPREREFSGVLSQLEGSQRSLLLSMMNQEMKTT